MKLISTICLTLIFGVSGFARKIESADTVVPRKDKNSMIAHEQLLEKSKKGQIDVYFFGDSITRRWERAMSNTKHFTKIGSKIFGVGTRQISVGAATQRKMFFGV
jgi:hypothetical protein